MLVDGELRLGHAQRQLLGLGGEQHPRHGQVVAVVGQHHEQVEQQLLAVLVHQGARVVQPQEQHVQHERHVHGPVHLHAVHHDVRQQHDGQVTPVEAAAGLRAVREVLGERGEVAAVLGHGQRVRLRDVELVGRRAGAGRRPRRHGVRVLGLRRRLRRGGPFVGQGRGSRRGPPLLRARPQG